MLRAAPYVFLLALLAGLAVFIPGVGVRAAGASRWLHLGPLSLLGLSVRGFASERGVSARKGKACILLYMTGGPAQQETFDLKRWVHPAASGWYWT